MSPREQADPHLAAAIRGLREATAQTQEDVAYQAGISVGALSRIESSVANPSWTTVVRIAAALNASMVDLATAVSAQGG